MARLREGESAMDGWIWGLMVVGGPVLLGVVLLIFGRRRKRVSQAEKTLSNEATRQNWGKEKIH